jgi:hypothetical protein
MSEAIIKGQANTIFLFYFIYLIVAQIGTNQPKSAQISPDQPKSVQFGPKRKVVKTEIGQN